MTTKTESLDVSESYSDAQIRLKQIREKIQKARTFLQCGAETEKHYRETREQISELKEQRKEIKQYWDEKSQT
jgi:predicted  nucleic acid-binding Zn-ribbon protein